MSNKKSKKQGAAYVREEADDIIRVDRNSGIYVSKNGHEIMTFEVEGADFFNNEEKEAVVNTDLACRQIKNCWVPNWGVNNHYPEEVAKLVRHNKLLPSVLRKQIDFLYGHGPILYKEEFIDGKRSRNTVYDDEILRWLENWESEIGVNWKEYIRRLITDYYFVNTCVSQWIFSNARKLEEGQNGSCIIGLKHIPADMSRLGTQANPNGKRILDEDCKQVVVGDWRFGVREDFEMQNRFDPKHPYANAKAISFYAEKSFGCTVYAYNEWFDGLTEWIKASNLTPKYLNNYLKTALNAHIHVKIPASWVNSQRERLQDLCQHNLMVEAGGQLTEEYKGVRLVDERGVACAFSEDMVTDLTQNEIRKITNMMSGEGKNQGKVYASISDGQNEWQFEPMPTKFKEFFDAVISYDKRADQVVLAGIGISSSISNVENDGVLSKSGSDVYYNYVIYLNTLEYPENIICKAINEAIALRFPNKKIKVGFDIRIPVKQQDTTPADRVGADLNK